MVSHTREVSGSSPLRPTGEPTHTSASFGVVLDVWRSSFVGRSNVPSKPTKEGRARRLGALLGMRRGRKVPLPGSLHSRTQQPRRRGIPARHERTERDEPAMRSNAILRWFGYGSPTRIRHLVAIPAEQSVRWDRIRRNRLRREDTAVDDERIPNRMTEAPNLDPLRLTSSRPTWWSRTWPKLMKPARRSPSIAVILALLIIGAIAVGFWAIT